MKWPFELELDQVRGYIDFWKAGFSQEFGLSQDIIKDIFKPDIAFAQALAAQLPPDFPGIDEIWEETNSYLRGVPDYKVVTGPCWDGYIMIRSLGDENYPEPYPMSLKAFVRDYKPVTVGEPATTLRYEAADQTTVDKTAIDATTQKTPKLGDIWCGKDGSEDFIFIERANQDFAEVKQAHTPSNWHIAESSFVLMASEILADYRFFCHPKEDMEANNEKETK